MWAGPDARPQLHRHTTLAIQPNYSASPYPDYGPFFSKLVLTPNLSSTGVAMPANHQQLTTLTGTSIQPMPNLEVAMVALVLVAGVTQR